MNNNSISLRDRALLAYRQVLAEKLQENRLYQQLTLRDAMQLKLGKLFGFEHFIAVEENTDERLLGAAIEEFNFLGLRSDEGDVNLILVEPCFHCGYKMTSKPLTSLADLGREILQLEITGILSNHDCSDSTNSYSS